jgi:hypothetical protein
MVWAWDGEWTNAKSGTEGALYDQGSTLGTAGTEGRIHDPGDSTSKAGGDPVQTYWIPNNPQFADVDQNESRDYRHHDFSPYVLVQFSHDVKYGSQAIGKGYYLVQPAGPLAGSPNKSLEQVRATDFTLGDTHVIPPPVSSQKWFKPKPPPSPAQALILKKLGKVVAVLPVQQAMPVPKGWWKLQKKHGKEPVKASFKHHLGGPLAIWTYENQVPTLHIYDKFWHYQVAFFDNRPS